jgi:hypothetical protein
LCSSPSMVSKCRLDNSLQIQSGRQTSWRRRPGTSPRAQVWPSCESKSRFISKKGGNCGRKQELEKGSGGIWGRTRSRWGRRCCCWRQAETRARSGGGAFAMGELRRGGGRRRRACSGSGAMDSAGWNWKDRQHSLQSTSF